MASRQDIEAADLAIARGEELVEHQRQRVELMRLGGYDTAQAERLLNLMIDTLDLLLRRRAAME